MNLIERKGTTYRNDLNLSFSPEWSECTPSGLKGGARGSGGWAHQTWRQRGCCYQGVCATQDTYPHTHSECNDFTPTLACCSLLHQLLLKVTLLELHYRRWMGWFSDREDNPCLVRLVYRHASIQLELLNNCVVANLFSYCSVRMLVLTSTLVMQIKLFMQMIQNAIARILF